MKFYKNLDVSLTYQNFGTAYYGILRGKTEHIELAFNGLFNFGATNGGLDYFDHAKTVAVFWTSRKQLRKFFFNRRYIPNMPSFGESKLSDLRPHMKEARQYLHELKDNGHEVFLNFADNYMPEPHSVGRVTAERPDNDMKDAIISHAYRDRTGEKVA